MPGLTRSMTVASNAADGSNERWLAWRRTKMQMSTADALPPVSFTRPAHECLGGDVAGEHRPDACILPKLIQILLRLNLQTLFFEPVANIGLHVGKWFPAGLFALQHTDDVKRRAAIDDRAHLADFQLEEGLVHRFALQRTFGRPIMQTAVFCREAVGL